MHLATCFFCALTDLLCIHLSHSSGPWDIRRITHDEIKTSRPLLKNSDLKCTTSDSSLGILDNSANSTNGGSADQPKATMSDGNSVSARNTSELFSCIVGVPREAGIEVSNRSDRRMTCSLTLHEIQASEEHISLDLPEDTLVDAGSRQLLKVSVKVRQMSSPDLPRSPASNRSGHSGRHSPGSAASTSTVSGDVMPIQSTHTELVWSSLKTGLTDGIPNNPGACAGEIIFEHYTTPKDQAGSTQQKTIFLYGYGGIGKVEIPQALKTTAGRMWLSLGHMNPEGRLSVKIKLENTGDLCSYAVAKLMPEALYPDLISSWQVNPAELLLGSGETQWINLKFHPRREDLALLLAGYVCTVGTISITHGDEPTRWRIRRLYNKLKESGELRRAENDTFRNTVFPLRGAFPGEALIQDLGLIRDPVEHLDDLCRGVSQHQIMLTMEVKNVSES